MLRIYLLVLAILVLALVGTDCAMAQPPRRRRPSLTEGQAQATQEPAAVAQARQTTTEKRAGLLKAGDQVLVTPERAGEYPERVVETTSGWHIFTRHSSDILQQQQQQVQQGSLTTPVLLLHGAAFNSYTWGVIGVCEALDKASIPWIAVDLPGFRLSQSSGGNDADRSNLIPEILTALGFQHAVVVTPSASGAFSLSTLFGSEKVSNTISKLVTIAPVATDKFRNDQYLAVDIPTWIVYGQDDNRIGQPGAKLLAVIPGSTSWMVPFGSHPCYLDEPGEFAERLVAFVQQQ